MVHIQGKINKYQKIVNGHNNLEQKYIILKQSPQNA